MTQVLNIHETAQANLRIKSARVRWSKAALELLAEDVAAGKSDQQISEERGIDKARVAKARSYHITRKKKRSALRKETTERLAAELIRRANTTSIGSKLVWGFLVLVALTILIAVLRLLASV